jgi:hypothetical protein
VRDENANSHHHPYTNPDAFTYPYLHINSNTLSYFNLYANFHINSHRNFNRHFDPHGYRYTHTYRSR